MRIFKSPIVCSILVGAYSSDSESEFLIITTLLDSCSINDGERVCKSLVDIGFENLLSIIGHVPGIYSCTALWWIVSVLHLQVEFFSHFIAIMLATWRRTENELWLCGGDLRMKWGIWGWNYNLIMVQLTQVNHTPRPLSNELLEERFMSSKSHVLKKGFSKQFILHYPKIWLQNIENSTCTSCKHNQIKLKS